MTKPPSVEIGKNSLQVNRALWVGIEKPKTREQETFNRRQARKNLIRFYDLEDELEFTLTDENFYLLNPNFREESYYWNDYLNQVLTFYFEKFPLFFGSGFTASRSSGSIETMGTGEIVIDYGKEVGKAILEPFVDVGNGVRGLAKTFGENPLLTVLGVGLLAFGGYYLLTRKSLPV